jgi:hypothetical protein
VVLTTVGSQDIATSTEGNLCSDDCLDTLCSEDDCDYYDCQGVCNGDSVVDDWGVCCSINEIAADCYSCGNVVQSDCQGVCGGSAVNDCAGVCGGPGALDGVNADGDCCATGAVDCAGVCDGDGSSCSGDGGEVPTDGCELPENTVFVTDSGDVLYNVPTDFAGVQFNVDGLNPTGASGGQAANAGWILQAAVGLRPSTLNCTPAKSVGTLYRTSPESVTNTVFSGSSQPSVGTSPPSPEHDDPSPSHTPAQSTAPVAQQSPSALTPSNAPGPPHTPAQSFTAEPPHTP